MFGVDGQIYHFIANKYLILILSITAIIFKMGHFILKLKHSIKNKLVSDNKKSIACCITTKGEIIRMENNKAFNKDIFILFLKKLNLEANTVLVLDNVPFHHSNIVKQFLKDKNVKM